MNRSQALAPLAPGEGRFPVEVGALIRGQFRRALVQNMVDFYEEKGFLESTFIVRGPADTIRAVHRWVQRNVVTD